MKSMKRILAMAALGLAVLLPVLAVAETFGAAAVNTGETYTVEQMLHFAIEDEYMAQAEYAAIIDAYGANAPFTNIIRAEATHITLLTRLFDAYGLTLPANTAVERTVLPGSLAEAYTTGIAAENANIAMYAQFLAQAELPQDVADTFTALQNASVSHLAAFTQNAEKTGAGARHAQMGNGNGRNANTKAESRGKQSTDCPLGDACLATGLRQERNPRSGQTNPNN